MSGRLCLSWNNHNLAFSKLLNGIYMKDLYSDGTILCQGKFYPVHRFVLSTCSEYFEDIFQQCIKLNNKHPFIIVKDIEPELMEALLSYMYKGELNVAQEMLPELMKAAGAFKVKGLVVTDEEGSPQPSRKRASIFTPPSLSKKMKNDDRQTNLEEVCNLPILSELLEASPSTSKSIVDEAFVENISNKKIKTELDPTPDQILALESCQTSLSSSKSSQDFEMYEGEDFNNDFFEMDSSHDNINTTCYAPSENQSNDLFPLPSFSEYVAPYLNGTAPMEKRKSMRDEIICELIMFLNHNSLLTSSNTMEQSWGYRKLQRSILNSYPNFCVDESPRRYKPKGPLGYFMNLLADRRRKKTASMTRAEENMFIDPYEAKKALECSDTFSKMSAGEKVRALSVSKELRWMEPSDPESLPPYLQTVKMMQRELEMVLNEPVKVMEANLKKAIQKTSKSLNLQTWSDIQSYLASDENRLIQEGEPDPEKEYIAPCMFMKSLSAPSETKLYLSKKCIISFPTISLVKALVLVFGTYHLKHIPYPKCYEQILGLVQTLIMEEPFPPDLHTGAFTNILLAIQF